MTGAPPAAGAYFLGFPGNDGLDLAAVCPNGVARLLEVARGTTSPSLAWDLMEVLGVEAAVPARRRGLSAARALRAGVVQGGLLRPRRRRPPDLPPGPQMPGWGSGRAQFSLPDLSRGRLPAHPPAQAGGT
ncbi:hypothetical protein [Dankookia sp. P2]|uniref:hypothetical protein n=1 Tax=Dankookia sp. P2 TaxID=3423955 RepID=UPI003D66D2F4